MHALQGTALLGNGSPASRVLVHEWVSGRFAGDVVPAANGAWEVRALNSSLTYQASAHGPTGWAPAAHGPLSPVLGTDNCLIDLRFAASDVVTNFKSSAIDSYAGFTTEANAGSISGFASVGSSTARIDMVASNAFRPLTGSFALMAEIYVNTLSATQVIIDTRPTVFDSAGIAVYLTTGGILSVYGFNGSLIVEANTSIPLNTWVEIVVQRTNTLAGGVELYINKIKNANTGTISGSLTDNAFRVFRQQDNVNSFLGKCRRLRWYVNEVFYA